MYKIKLKIADIIIAMKSEFPIEYLDNTMSFRYKNFIYRGNRNLDISMGIRLVRALPLLKKDTKRIFLTRHFQSDQLNWALFKNKNYYVLREYPSGKNQHYILSHDFSKAEVYLLRKRKDEFSWNLEEIIYDALQVILIHYFSRRGAIFTHAVGIKDNSTKGLLFIGKSGQGKSTSARLWHKHSRAKVLNDDRIILRKIDNKFFIYGSPWHGDFSDYLTSRVDRARLKSIFFISHSRKNRASVLKKRIFSFLYPCLFPAFWDREGLEKTVNMCNELFSKVPCFKLGFRNDKSVIKFIRTIDRKEVKYV